MAKKFAFARKMDLLLHEFHLLRLLAVRACAFVFGSVRAASSELVAMFTARQRFPENAFVLYRVHENEWVIRTISTACAHLQSTFSICPCTTVNCTLSAERTQDALCAMLCVSDKTATEYTIRAPE